MSGDLGRDKDGLTCFAGSASGKLFRSKGASRLLQKALKLQKLHSLPLLFTPWSSGSVQGRGGAWLAKVAGRSMNETPVCLLTQPFAVTGPVRCYGTLDGKWQTRISLIPYLVVVVVVEGFLMEHPS